ncbi:hypothetical protein [Fibrobacter sp. UWB7]|uniref:hypothetical protein n=1 Tax=Fibrobacter sp. UWB7 TaxID=1896206 RepID=UPI00091A9FBB|nr:hypothetical protein [Fibrobacter sp. UWB7]SHM94317.1 hypothetical protein SAMN05720467_2825 [Fibrobacter sp. UWB7]
MSLKESIKQLQKREHITQDELLRRLGCSRSGLMDHATTDAQAAFQLAFGSDSSRISDKDNLESISKAAFFKDKENLEKILMWVRKFPIRALQKKGHIPENVKDADLVCAVFKFMQIGSIAGFENYYGATLQSANPQTYAAWIRLGELQVKRLATDYTPDRKAIISNLNFLRTNVFLSNQSIRKIAREVLNNCGIEYVEVEPFLTAPTPVCAFYWRGSRPVIQFPTTKMEDSKFLEALFHAVGHLLLHPKHTSCLQLGAFSQQALLQPAQTPELLAARPEDILELEASHFAQDLLLSEAEECELICCGRFNERRCIEHFSGVFHVRPSILVERLQQQGKLRRRTLLNDFKIAV